MQDDHVKEGEVKRIREKDKETNREKEINREFDKDKESKPEEKERITASNIFDDILDD